MVFYLGRPAFAIEGEKVKIREKNKMKDDGEKIKKKLSSRMADLSSNNSPHSIEPRHHSLFIWKLPHFTHCDLLDGKVLPLHRFNSQKGSLVEGILFDINNIHHWYL